MMFAHRIIPTLLCRGRQLVKGERFDSWRSVGVAAQAVRIHQMRGVDELLLLDIGATPEGRTLDYGLVEELAATCFMPLTVGGGISAVADVDRALRSGADKVCVGTAALLAPSLIGEIANRFGRQVLTVSIDARGGLVSHHCGKAQIPMTPVGWAVECEWLGAGEILLNNVERDGTLQGYDLALIAEVSEAVDIPVVAAGGCKDYEDIANAIRAGASAVAAGALFQFTDATPQGAARYLVDNGIGARVA